MKPKGRANGNSGLHLPRRKQEWDRIHRENQANPILLLSDYAEREFFYVLLCCLSQSMLKRLNHVRANIGPDQTGSVPMPIRSGVLGAWHCPRLLLQGRHK